MRYFKINNKPLAFYDLKTKQITIDLETMDVMDWFHLKPYSMKYIDWLMECYDHSTGRTSEPPKDVSVKGQVY